VLLKTNLTLTRSLSRTGGEPAAHFQGNMGHGSASLRVDVKS